ncbi:endoglucanase 2 [Astrocystis sublimbata]|nr:endoglucanase 2 [Astrocystis sublimbata]
MLTMFFPTLLTFALAPAALAAKLEFLGVAIAGGEFGCEIDGTCPLGSAQLAFNDGPAQMNHFVKEDGMNVLRIPTSWQFLVNNQLGGDIDSSQLGQYDQLVQACLDTGAHCMIDVHNFARWDGEIIGQGGPTDEQFASFWGQLAGNYAANEKIIFELMNEPHDLDVGKWADTCQKAVTAIREAGATSQMILLPGTDFDSAASLVSSGSADALMAITNPDKTTDNLLLDIHKYLDEDNSGTHAECTTDNLEAFTAVAEYLRKKGRKGFVSETGASSDATCLTAFCAQNEFINKNSDVFAGLVAWSAGSFDTSYILSLTPSNENGGLVDNELAKQCVLGQWKDVDVEVPSSGGATTTVKHTSYLPSTSTATASATSTETVTSPTASSAATASSTTLLITTSLLSMPTAIVTASFSMPTFSASKNGTASTFTFVTSASAGSGSSSAATSSKLNINTSNVLILTDVYPSSTMSTLAIATGTPPPRSALDGLLTADPEMPVLPTQTAGLEPAEGSGAPASTTSRPAAAGAGAVAVGGLALWGTVGVAVVALLVGI